MALCPFCHSARMYGGVCRECGTSRGTGWGLGPRRKRKGKKARKGGVKVARAAVRQTARGDSQSGFADFAKTYKAHKLTVDVSDDENEGD